MKVLKKPASVQWELTPVCNHDCIHCYNYWRNDKTPLRHPNIDYMKIAIAICKADPVHVVLTGGEPLLVFDRVFEAVNYMAEKGIFISWNTNAVMVTKDIAKSLRKWNATAFVSLPCGDSEICDKIVNVPNALEKIEKGIKTLLSESVPVSVNMVISAYNIDKIYETAKVAKKLGIKQFCLAPASRPFGADRAFDEMAPPADVVEIMCREAIHIEKELGLKVSLTGALPGCAFESEMFFQHFAYKKSCTAGKVSYAVDFEGNMKACARDNKTYGNLLKEEVSVIWRRMSEWRDGSLLPTDCKECTSLKICHGGCRLEACSSTGRRDGMDTFARKQLIPPSFKKEVPVYLWSEKTVFKVYSGLKWSKEEFGWRVSLGPRFTYVTDCTRKWLLNHRTFCLKEMENEFGLEIREVLKTTIHILVNSGIIHSDGTNINM